MKVKIIVFFLLLANLTQAKKHIIFLHNRFLETHSVDELHEKYGKVEWAKIIQKFQVNGFAVIATKRDSNVTVNTMANRVVFQIDSILKIDSNDSITVVGTSKGGYIAQLVSTRLKNEAINYVFIGCFQVSDINEMPNINFCGNVLTIYEKTDPYGVSAIKRKELSNLSIPHFKEVELNTGLNHGFLFKALDGWLLPCIKWANCKFE